MDRKQPPTIQLVQLKERRKRKAGGVGKLSWQMFVLEAVGLCPLCVGVPDIPVLCPDRLFPEEDHQSPESKLSSKDLYYRFEPGTLTRS